MRDQRSNAGDQRTPRRGIRALALLLGCLIVLTAAAGGGWLLIRHNRNAATPVPVTGHQPSTSGRPTYVVLSGAANDHNTGVPAGTRLKRHDGNLEITKDGTVVDALDIHGTVEVKARNVIIQRTRVTSPSYHPVYIHESDNVVIRDSEIAGEPGCALALGVGHFTAERVNIHGCHDGVRAGPDVTVRQCYIHDLRHDPGAHNDGIQSTNGSNITLVGNTILNPDRQTSAILLKADFGDISHVVVKDNFLVGGAYTFYALPGKKFKISDVTVESNVFGGHALFGSVDTAIELAWSGNRTSDGQQMASPHGKSD